MTPTSPTDGDFVSLREHLEGEIRNLEKQISAAYPDRKELLALIAKMSDRITELETFKNIMAGKADESMVHNVRVVAYIGIFFSILAIALEFILR